nr:zinc finger protein 280D [Pogona vitticeps]XP_020640458.1 zinc finger protein 280D [Pogona vitticeps]XP_020640459.1 zinc finger protein 280D [Pogona vitticeps]XP_020640460.1 zinc finger protein 280D [Pogona vitticeps]XP_020640461.1 zinc finger protein 280D [Pogona vitticeps]
MAELFMECEEEELELWQQKSKPIVVDDDDDDDEPIFVGEILSSKPTSTYILNRVNPSSSRVGLQNGAPKRGAVPVSPGFQLTTRPATSTLAVQPQPRVSSVSGTAQVLQRPLSGCPSPQEAAKSSAGLSQPVGRPAMAPSLSRNLSIPVQAQSTSRPVATVTAQPVTFNRGTPSNTSGVTFGSRQNSGGPQCQSGPAVNTTSLPKRPSTSEANSVSPKKAKASETGSGSESPGLLLAQSSSDPSLLQKGTTSSSIKNGAPFPQACPKCNIHFNLLEPLKNHIKYCCPDMVPAFRGGTQMDCSGTPAKMAEAESGKLIMLVNDFYYSKHKGNVQLVRQEQKTHTTYKCASCMKLLKSNLRFMNHMKHHLELEKQNSESWESHTTCQHCYRQFPTPFQLQCHIESTHTPHESSTICKICELSFETEQVLLQHMKDNHKPGEMPYVCQVCSYRSSAFSDVEKHFRAVHENTKNLLCPFCLKVIKIGAPYMHHFMRHQKKGVHRCTKCRLQFLTCKEKMDHKSQHHRTFKKPPQLEGLPLGTKVTIRASVGSLPPTATAAPAVYANASAFPLSPVAKTPSTKSFYKGSANKAKSKLKPLSLQKKQSVGSSSSGSSSSSSSGSSNKNNKIANAALNNLRCPDIQKCIECYSDIRTFASHFPAYVRCSLCRYSTSCSKAYVNHMMSFHSARQTKRFWIYKTHSDNLRGTTVVCLNCDFLTDASGVDKMAAHLNDNDTHTCQIVAENVPLDSRAVAAAALPDQSSGVLLNNESDGKSQKCSRRSTPGEQEGASVSKSARIDNGVEAENQDPLGKPSDEAAWLLESAEPKSPLEGNSFAPGPPVCATDAAEPVEEEARGALGVPPSEGASISKGEEELSPVSEEVSGPGPQGCSQGRGAEEGGAAGLGNKTERGLIAAEGEENAALPMEEDSSPVEAHPCSEGSAGEARAEDTASQRKEWEEKISPSGLAGASRSGPSAHSEDPVGATKEGSVGYLADQEQGGLAAECEGNAPLSVLGDTSSPGPSGGSEDKVDGGQDDAAGRLIAPGGDGLATECIERTPPSAPERSASGTPADPAESDGEVDSLASRGEAFPAAEGGEEPLPPSAPETPSLRVSSPCAAVPADAAREGDGGALESEAEEASLAAEGGEASPASSPEEPSLAGAQGCPDDPSEETTRGQLGNNGTQACEGSPPAPSVEDGPRPGLQAGPAGSPSREKAALEGDPAGGDGEASCQTSEEAASEVQAGKSPSEEGELVDVKLVNTDPTSDEDVSFEQFLSRNGESVSANSDTSEQGSVHLEPLTPSEVLEHEATEILQKGAAAAVGTGAEAEQTEGASSREGSPVPDAASGGTAEGGGSDEAS